jgi:hypothetical protein
VQALLEIVNSHRYVYKGADAPTSWAFKKGLTELNVSNVQLLALIGTYAPDQTTACRTVYEYRGKTIRVCN